MVGLEKSVGGAGERVGDVGAHRYERAFAFFLNLGRKRQGSREDISQEKRDKTEGRMKPAEL